MWNNLFFVLIGLSAGCLVSAGIFAFLTAIGLLQRLAAKTCTASKARLYEDLHRARRNFRQSFVSV